MDTDEVLVAAKKAKEAGSTRLVQESFIRIVQE